MMVRVDAPPAGPGCIWWLVMTPSISTWGTELMVTTTTTRSIGVCAPAIRKTVLSTDSLLKANTSSNPLSPVVLLTTFTLCRASIATLGAGSGTTGPTRSAM